MTQRDPPAHKELSTRNCCLQGAELDAFAELAALQSIKRGPSRCASFFPRLLAASSRHPTELAASALAWARTELHHDLDKSLAGFPWVVMSVCEGRPIGRLTALSAGVATAVGEAVAALHSLPVRGSSEELEGREATSGQDPEQAAVVWKPSAQDASQQRDSRAGHVKAPCLGSKGNQNGSAVGVGGCNDSLGGNECQQAWHFKDEDAWEAALKAGKQPGGVWEPWQPFLGFLSRQRAEAARKFNSDAGLPLHLVAQLETYLPTVGFSQSSVSLVSPFHTLVCVTPTEHVWSARCACSQKAA